MGINRMTGSPWHIENLHSADGDDRRYKGRCVYYQYNNNRCTSRGCHCIGSTRCSIYREISEEEFKERQKANQKEKQAEKQKREAAAPLNKKKKRKDKRRQKMLDEIFWWEKKND